jgi:transcriptional regulator with XRE-family HTH domain
MTKPMTHKNLFLHGAHRHEQMHMWQAIGERLRVVRIALNLTEDEAAEAFGVTVRSYRRYEAGDVKFRGERWLRFCYRYKISTDWLICGDGRRLKAHLARAIGGKVAILPVLNCSRQASNLAP